jgi:hypothetical protein
MYTIVFYNASKSGGRMFGILPLQIASNIFLAESSEDLDLFYGFDKLAVQQVSNPLSPAKKGSRVSTGERIASGDPEIIDLDVSGESGRFLISNPPRDIRRIWIFQGNEALTEIMEGDVGVIMTNNGPPRAYFRPDKEGTYDFEIEELVNVLKGS